MNCVLAFILIFSLISPARDFQAAVENVLWAEQAAASQQQSSVNGSAAKGKSTSQDKVGAMNPRRGGRDSKSQPAASTSANKPHKTVVKEGGASEPSTQIVTGMSPEEANTQRQEAERWLDSADENLKRLAGRTLAVQQQEDLSQIHNYMQTARAALTEGDLPRGHMLAMKANMLAENLVKH